MIQTKGEILAAYKDRPNAKRIQEIADKNNVTANEIRKVLHDAGEDVAVFEKRGPGRPKKEEPETVADETLKSIDDTLSNESEEKTIKVMSASFQSSAEEVPKVVLGLCRERIASINRQIQVYVEQVDLLNTERNDLIEFVEKAVEHGEKDGVHRKV
jgi:hypothetical protein